MYQNKVPAFSYKIFACVFFLFFCSFSYSQNSNDNISIYQLNEKYLEHLVKEKIDEVRVNHGLTKLYNDSILFVAAKFHANYLFKKKDLSHEEKENPIMETPQKRAEFFGAVNYLVGENILFTVVNSPVKDKKGKVYTNSTYDQTAADMVVGWVNSPGHYKNIITADYNARGLAIWADQETGRIYAVQKFAKILFKYKFDENKQFFSYSNFKLPEVVSSFKDIDRHVHKGKHVHKLKTVKKPEVCTRCEENKPNFAFGKTHLEYKGNTLYLASYSFDPIFKMLKKRKDGFAAEIVTYKPYDCGNPQYYTRPSRRNNQCVFSGKVLKPVYKKQALRAFKPAGKNRKALKANIDNGKVKKYLLKLGKIPKDMKEFYEVNLVIIQKKRVCNIMHFSSFCGDTLEKFYHLPFHPDSIANKSEIKEDYKNIAFSIPFQKNKTEYNMSDIKPITDSLLNETFVADTIVIRAFSSVEGSEAVNKQLQEQRANHIVNAISSQQKEKLNKIISSEENWMLFEKQVNENTDLAEFKNITRDKIKEKLLDTLLQKKIEKYLSKQRIAKIRLHAKEIINDKNIEKYLLGKIKSTKSKINKYAVNEKKADTLLKYVDTLNFYMEVTYNKIKAGIIKPEFFQNFDIGREKKFNKYNLAKVKYWVQIHGAKSENIEWAHHVYEDLVNLYNNDERSFFINYNMLNLVQLYGKEMNVFIKDTEQNNFINELRALEKDSVEKLLTDKLALNFWFAVCRLPEQEQPKDKLPVYYSSLTNIYKYFKNKTLPQSDMNKLAAFYLYHSLPTWVNEILWPEYEKRKNNPEGLRLLAKVNYQNYEETGNKEYYDFLKDVYTIIGKENWCPMFVGPCNISFQAFDYEDFRNFYCEKCNDYLNYAKAPPEKNKKK